MIDREALELWLAESLNPAMASADRLVAFMPVLSQHSRQQRDHDLALLRSFVESGCGRCPLGCRDGTVDSLLLHLMIVLDSSFHARLRRLRRMLRQLAGEGSLPDVLIAGAVAPVYGHGRRVVPAHLAVRD